MRPGYLALLAWLQPIAAQWIKPSAANPGLTDTYTVGETIIFSWLPLNDSLNDLWVTRYDTSVDTFALRLTVSRDVSIGGSYEWPVAFDHDKDRVQADGRFILQFLPAGSTYNASTSLQLASPAFNLILVGQNVPANGAGSMSSGITITSPRTSTVGSMPTVVTLSTSTSTTQPSSTSSVTGDSNGRSPLSSGAKIGIGIGVIGIVTILGCMLVALLLVRRQRRYQKNQMGSEKADGPYEILGDKRMPMELSSQDTSISELNGGKETAVSEACSSPIHEIGGMTKKPGLHELPG